MSVFTNYAFKEPLTRLQIRAIERLLSVGNTTSQLFANYRIFNEVLTVEQQNEFAGLSQQQTLTDTFKLIANLPNNLRESMEIIWQEMEIAAEDGDFAQGAEVVAFAKIYQQLPNESKQLLLNLPGLKSITQFLRFSTENTLPKKLLKDCYECFFRYQQIAATTNHGCPDGLQYDLFSHVLYSASPNEQRVKQFSEIYGDEFSKWVAVFHAKDATFNHRQLQIIARKFRDYTDGVLEKNALQAAILAFLPLELSPKQAANLRKEFPEQCKDVQLAPQLTSSFRVRTKTDFLTASTLRAPGRKKRKEEPPVVPMSKIEKGSAESDDDSPPIRPVKRNRNQCIESGSSSESSSTSLNQFFNQYLRPENNGRPINMSSTSSEENPLPIAGNQQPKGPVIIDLTAIPDKKPVVIDLTKTDDESLGSSLTSGM